MIAEFLARDPELTFAVMSPVDLLTDDQVPKVRALLERYPNSSYAPYGHFALARHSIHKINVVDGAWAKARAELELAAAVDFPYHPNVLVAQWTWDEGRRERVADLLRRHYSGSAELLHRLGWRVGPSMLKNGKEDFEDWWAWRKRRPEPFQPPAPSGRR